MNKPNPRRSNIVWLQPDGLPVSCEEKLKVLNENLDEIRQPAGFPRLDGTPNGLSERISPLRHRLVGRVIRIYHHRHQRWRMVWPKPSIKKGESVTYPDSFP